MAFAFCRKDNSRRYCFLEKYTKATKAAEQGLLRGLDPKIAG